MRIVYLAERLSYLSLILLIGSAATVRLELLNFRFGLLAFAAAGLLALTAITLSALFTRRCPNEEDRKRLSRAAIIALPAMGLVALNVLSGSNRPMIHDISTDLASPPVFIAAPALRSDADNSLAYPEANPAIQARAYPKLSSIRTELSLPQAQQLALAVAQEMNWEVHYQQDGHIEAVSRSFWFGFADDIVIRMQNTASGTVLDLRSASRLGKGDLGVNARRIERFTSRFTARLERANQDLAK